MSVFLHIMPVFVCYLEYAAPILSLNRARGKDVLPLRGQGVGMGGTRGTEPRLLKLGCCERPGTSRRTGPSPRSPIQETPFSP